VDTTTRLLLAAVTGTAVTAILRQRREAAAVRAGRLATLGPSGTPDANEVGTGLHAIVAGWHPERPRSLAGRVAAAMWAAPLTAVGIAVTAVGGTIPAWQDAYGMLVALDVRGPARWFLRAQSANAATLGQTVVVRDAVASHRLLTHESAHARQQERLGLLFAIAYPVASALWGYRRNPFEVAARARARSVSESPASV
jgi:hypothetical protein